MSQQPRRTARTTRSTKDTENANARPSSRLITRTKPTSTTTAPTKGTSSTAVTRAKTVLTNAKPDATAPAKRKRAALGEIAAPSNQSQKEKPMSKRTTKDKPKEKFDGVVLKRSTITTTTTTSTIRQPLKAVAGGVPQSRKAVISVSDQVQQLEQIHEDIPVGSDPMAIDPPHRVKAEILQTKSLRVVSSRKQLKPIGEVDEEESKRVVKKRRTSSDLPEEAGIVAHVPPEGIEEDVVAHPKRFATSEADPDGDQWDDLDAEDADDPLMVSEYVDEIFAYLKGVEKTTMPNPNYMEMQKDLAWKMRGILTDWLIQVHSRFHLLPETLFLCVNIIDRFLSARVVSLVKLQLVGITCMFIAAKVEEIISPSASNFLYCADSSYSETEILQAERYILKTLDWNLSYPNPIHFLRRISKADQYNVQTRTIAKYLMEIQCLEWRLISAPPSVLAAASVWLARLILGREGWTPNLAHYSSYPESALIPTANIMLNYILKEPRHESFYKKYASKKFLKVSAYVREWALERWPQGGPVLLLEELPILKEEIRQARAKEIAEGGVVEEL
ncbi:hypothetical protein BDM02DRAFT_3088789 [Thelephora ganbajun]|uniref:Uncharacterized protein n=1 Tax=Thelephora ganbajun TaxID=370292 RepID=A0ACB6ZU91_THEGA|nr:hypothetical protein BDM02DRAFT_3088789 [Thelephora ganbajun]